MFIEFDILQAQPHSTEMCCFATGTGLSHVHWFPCVLQAQLHATSAAEIAELADVAGAKQLILTHLDDNDARTDELVRCGIAIASACAIDTPILI